MDMDVFRYTAALAGANVDLKLLAHCFTSDECKVELVNQPEVAAGPYYQLSSTRLKLPRRMERQLGMDGGRTVEIEIDVTSEDAVREAENLLSVMNGSARLVRSEYRPVTIAAMNQFSVHGRWLRTEGRTEMDWRDYSMPPERTGLAALTRQWAERGFQDVEVSKAFTIYGSLPLSWWMLYMVYEIIEGDTDDILTLVSENLKRDFKKAANNARALRDGPRHGFKTQVAEDRLMSLEEGHSVVRELLNRWLASKVGGWHMR